MFKNLNLTNTQKQQIHKIIKNQHNQIKHPPLKKHHTIHNIITNNTFNKIKTKAQITKIKKQHKTNILTHIKTQNKIYNILTPKQKKQFNTNFKKHLTKHPTTKNKIPTTTK